MDKPVFIDIIFWGEESYLGLIDTILFAQPTKQNHITEGGAMSLTPQQNELKRLVLNSSPYAEVVLVAEDSNDVLLTAMTRQSRLARADPGSEATSPDMDIVQISVDEKCRRKGVATAFLRDLVAVADAEGRRVLVEQAFTDDSRAWCKRLVEEGAMRALPQHLNNYAVLPEHHERLRAVASTEHVGLYKDRRVRAPTSKRRTRISTSTSTRKKRKCM